MIPIGDSVRSRSFPYVNVTIIALCVLVFLYELTQSTVVNQPFAGIPQFGFISELDKFIFKWGSIPACLGDAFGFSPDVDARAVDIVCGENDGPIATAIASMFVHGGWLHLIGNMVFLWVFGDNVEDAMGHARYALFYVLAGFAATAGHVFFNQNELIPAIGASGAIAGVLGAYILLFPRARITAILPLFLLWLPFQLPAVALIGVWFVMQLLNGVAALGAACRRCTGSSWGWRSRDAGWW